MLNETAMTWGHLGELLKLLGAAAVPFSLYLALKKIGHRALASYSIQFDKFTASRIDNIVITNCKDKPLIVHAIYADIEAHALLTVKSFQPPLIIKALESAVIACNPVSSYQINGQPYKFSFQSGLRDLHILTTGKTFKCIIDDTPTVFNLARRLRYEKINSVVTSYMGKAFNEHALYGLSFLYNGKRHVALVGDDGYIGADWPFRGNALLTNQLTSAETVRSVLEEAYGDVLNGSLMVHELHSDNENAYIDVSMS